MNSCVEKTDIGKTSRLKNQNQNGVREPVRILVGQDGKAKSHCMYELCLLAARPLLW